MKLKYAIIVTFLSFSIRLLLAEEVQQISQCGNGKATYYDASSNEGNCGFGNIAQTIDIAAAEELIYDGSRGCGVCYEVMGELGSKIVMIADKCPGCSQVTQTGKIHLDIDEKVFPYLDDKSKGVINTSLRMVSCQVTGNVKLVITETNPSYFNAYVTNYKIGVKALQISIDDGNYIDVKRETWNRFIASSLGNTNSIKVKIISFSDEEIICEGVTGIIQGEYDCGKQFSTNYFFDLYSKKLIEENKMSECCVKPSLINDITKCNVDTNSEDKDPEIPGEEDHTSEHIDEDIDEDIGEQVEVQQISQCGNGKATYYPVTGEGNCGFGDIAKTIDTAAAEELIYDGSRGCGVCYEVMGELGSKIIMIADRCPGCSQVTQTGKIHLDIDERVFPYLDDKNKGVINTSLRMVPCQVTGNVKLIITGTNPSYFNAYVTNYKIGVKALQISIDGGNYIDVKRETWNRFIASSLGNTRTLKVKIISFSDEEIICEGVTGIIQGEYDCGKQFSTNYFFDLYSKKLIEENKMSECCVKPSLINDITKCNVDSNYQDNKEDKDPDISDKEDKSESEDKEWNIGEQVEVQQISQCGNGKATYYPVIGEGNCGFGDIAKTIDTAAAEELIYDGSRGCGVCYEVMGELGSKIIMIADRCPGCSQVTQTGKIHLDIDERVFPYLDDKNKGVINTSLRMVPCQVTGNVKLIITETNPYYFNAYATNYKIGIKALQISIDGGNYINVKREMWNRFVASSLGNTKSLKVKIISFSDEEIICESVTGIIQGEYDCGKQFSTNYFFDLYSKKLIKENRMSECCAKPSLINDITKCNVDSNYQDKNSSIINLKLPFLFSIILLILY